MTPACYVISLVENSTNEDQSKGAGEDNSGYMLVNQLQLHNRSVRFEGSNTLPLTRIRSHDSELHSVGIGRWLVCTYVNVAKLLSKVSYIYM